MTRKKGMSAHQLHFEDSHCGGSRARAQALRQLCNDLMHKFLVGVRFSKSPHILEVSRAKPRHSRKSRMLSCWSRISVSAVGRSVLNVARLDSVLAWVGLRLAIRGMGQLDLIPLMGFCTSVLWGSYVARLQTSAA